MQTKPLNEESKTVIDVLRSSSTIINALANGANYIIPTATLKEAYKLHMLHPDYLLVSERRRHKPEGFNLGNSPLEFTPEQINGKNMIMTTTSGTIALTRCRQAELIFIGAFLNVSSVAEKAIKIAKMKEIGVSFVLADEKGRFSLEDFTCAAQS
jgi:2-phosphosulfolactate phosphatase